MRIFTDIITWVNYLDQILVSVLIFFQKGIFGTIKHLTFIVFILGIYLVAPVYGFGWLLCIFGMSIALDEKRFHFYRAYMGCILVLAVYQLVIHRLI